MKKGEHFKYKGLKAIINIRASIKSNRGLTPALKKAFPDFVPVIRPLIDVHAFLYFCL